MVKRMNFAFSNLRMEKKIQYTASPFKFRAENILEGLQEEIPTDRDVINKDDKRPESNAKRVVSAVITQFFSYITKTRVQYSYISTVDMIIFLHILNNPRKWSTMFGTGETSTSTNLPAYTILQ